MKKSDSNSKSFVKRIAQMSDTNLLLSITILVFVVMYLAAIFIMGGGMAKPQTICDILNDNAALIIVSCGLSIVMINASIDISVGGVVALVAMSCAKYLEPVLNENGEVVKEGGNVLLAVLIALGIGLAFGVVQGALVAFLDIQPFIVTLAGMFFARGLTSIISTQPITITNPVFLKIKEARIDLPIGSTIKKTGAFIPAYIEIGVLVALFIVALLFCVLQWCRLGRHFYAVGGNPSSALMLGIDVKKTKFLAHIMCGVLAGIGGYVYMLNVGTGSTQNALGMEMNAIASSIIGGTMLSGGVGNIAGTFFGVMSLNVIKKIVAGAGLEDAWWTNITIAVMLCLFLIIQSVVISQKRKAKK